MRRLSGIDTAALALETDASPLHMMAVLVLDTSVVPGGYWYERLREFLATRIDVVPPLLQLLRRVPGELHRPVWVDAPAIDWDYHLPRTILTEPLDLSRLGAFAAELAGRRLDRDRPLWQLHVVEDAGTERAEPETGYALSLRLRDEQEREPETGNRAAEVREPDHRTITAARLTWPSSVTVSV